MATSVRAALSTLLTINYLCGLRIAEFPVGHSTTWLRFLYNLLLWSVYCFLIVYIVIPILPKECDLYKIVVWFYLFMILISTLLATYHDKKFKSCLNKLTLVDNTLGQLGTTTDCQKLNKRVQMIVAGWTVLCFITNCFESIWWCSFYDTVTVIYIPFLINCSCYTNFITDLTFACILGYIGLKFDQVNQLLRKLPASESTDLDRRKVNLAWENPIMCTHRRRFPNTLNSESITWIVMYEFVRMYNEKHGYALLELISNIPHLSRHLHSELRKISHEVNSVFEIQMTLKMACYFGFIAQICSRFFDLFFVSYTNILRVNLYFVIAICWLVMYISILFIISYTCERVSAKANATGDFIKKVSYSTCDTATRENIMQLLLQLTQAPLKFYGMRLFQFGFKYLYGYFESVLTVLIILVQTNAEAVLQNVKD